MAGIEVTPSVPSFWDFCQSRKWLVEFLCVSNLSRRCQGVVLAAESFGGAQVSF
jgi:hypothetical protein